MSTPAADIEIRRMTLADIESVMALAAGLAHAPHYSAETWQRMLDPGSAPQRLALAAIGPAPHTFHGFAIAGIVPPQAELESIAVASASQRLGIGTRLLASIVEDLRSQRIAEILLDVRVSNHPAIALYRRFGFRETGRRTRYYLDPVEDALLMSLDLLPGPGTAA